MKRVFVANPLVSATRPTADILVDMIKRYWREEGYPKIDARAHVTEAVAMSRKGQVRRIEEIRSNIGPQGFPPR